MRLIIVSFIIICCVNNYAQWNPGFRPPYKDLKSITFADENTGYIVGNNLVIFKTLDKGESWSLVHSSSDNAYYFRGVSFINDSVGFTTGYIGQTSMILFKTTDGGHNWDTSSIANIDDCNEILFINDSTGFLCGREYNPFTTFWDARIVKTTNQGNTWIREFGNYDGTLYSIKFLNEQYGFAVGIEYPNGLILKTTDGGNNWERKNVGSPIRWHGVEIIDSENIIVSSTGTSGTVIKSSDGGQNWTTLVTGLANSQLRDIHFISPTQGNLISSDGKIFFTNDAGYNWVNSYQSNYMLSDLYFIDDTIGFAVGSNGFILRTTNGGITSVDDKTNTILFPSELELEQNYPNPFNPSTTINFSLPQKDFVTIKVYSLLGTEVATLVNEERPAGNYEIEFNAESLNSGVYFYKIETANFVQTKKMILMK